MPEENDIRPSPTIIARHVGKRLKRRRTELDMDIPSLVASSGLTARRIERAEAGKGGLNAGDLLALSKVLGVPVGYFFTGLRRPRGRDSAADEDMADLFRSLQNVDRPAVLRQIAALVRAVARDQD